MDILRMTIRSAALTAVLLPLTVAAAGNDPQTDPGAVVVAGNARFTVLTPRLIRMEWSEDGVFEDRATLTFVNRRLPVPEFDVSRGGRKTVIRTSAVKLTYNGGGRFCAENLKAEYTVGGEKRVWHFGDTDSLNLMGTTRTLDGTDGWKLGREPMEPGIVSRGGCVAVDDSRNHLFVPADSHWKEWVACRDAKDRQDIYLFAYGHDYTAAIHDYTEIAGAVPLPPRYAFGYWWSRYWQYSDNELRDLVSTMRSLDIPLDVLVIDMDWHETWSLRLHNSPKDEYGQRIGWTGYTWKEQLFPSPSNFLEWCHREGLKTSLNLHPASGIQPREKCYDAFADAYGWTKRGESVPFHIDDQHWADAYFSTVLGPMEREGVDFWWLDWQQWRTSRFTENLSNTFWLNHVFNFHMNEASDVRPMIYHRWGGLGSHRYQVGFSGDTVISWDTLDFLPWFTSTASNVCYGYWGHDIGGHAFRKGESVTEPELYLRWLQYGVFTPIFKTHCTKDGNIERRIWQFPDYMFLMRDAIRLRYTLAPYIYNAARHTFDTGISMCRPMYYRYPECDEAYEMKRQYMFGDDLIATSVSSAADRATGLADCRMWFPAGRWFDCATGDMIDGGITAARRYTVAENPYYARAGAIIPMNPATVRNLQEESGTLVLTFIPGGDGEVSLYEDDGLSKNYSEEFSTTDIVKRTDGNTIRIEISPRKGAYANMPAERRYELRLPATFPPRSVRIDGREAHYARYASDGEWTYDGNTLAPVIYTGVHRCDSACTIEIEMAEEDMADQGRLYGKQGVFGRCTVLTPEFKSDFAANYDPWTMLPDEYLSVSQAPSFITEYPSQIRKWLDRYDEGIAKLIPSLEESGILDSGFIGRLDAQLVQKPEAGSRSAEAQDATPDTQKNLPNVHRRDKK